MTLSLCLTRHPPGVRPPYKSEFIPLHYCRNISPDNGEFSPPPAVASFYHTTLRCPHHGHITARNHNATRRAGKSMASRAHIRWVSGPTSQTRPNRQHATPASNGCMPSSRDGPHMVSIDLDGTEDLPQEKQILRSEIGETKMRSPARQRNQVKRAPSRQKNSTHRIQWCP
jgi:hypothetical protein